MDSRLFGVGVGRGACARPPYLAGTSRRDDRPPTHFFVKKKFIPIGGAESTTQKVPSGLSYAHTLCGGGTLCHARNPPAIRFAPGPPPFNKGGQEVSASNRVCTNSVRHRESPRTQEGAFFFTKKASCGNQTICVAGIGKSVQTQPPLFPPLKKPFSNNGIPKGQVPLARAREQSSRGLAL